MQTLSQGLREVESMVTFQVLYKGKIEKFLEECGERGLIFLESKPHPRWSRQIIALVKAPTEEPLNWWFFESTSKDFSKEYGFPEGTVLWWGKYNE